MNVITVMKTDIAFPIYFSNVLQITIPVHLHFSTAIFKPRICLYCFRQKKIHIFFQNPDTKLHTLLENYMIKYFVSDFVLLLLLHLNPIYSPKRGALVFEYHPRKKIHIIRVVFQDKAMYVHTSFRGAKTCKIGKRVCFWSY